jgi:hypothetical protein
MLHYNYRKKYKLTKAYFSVYKSNFCEEVRWKKHRLTRMQFILSQLSSHTDKGYALALLFDCFFFVTKYHPKMITIIITPNISDKI